VSLVDGPGKPAVLPRGAANELWRVVV